MRTQLDDEGIFVDKRDSGVFLTWREIDKLYEIKESAYNEVRNE